MVFISYECTFTIKESISVLKKSLAIVLVAIFYLMSTSGMVISIHYCMGKVSSVELFASMKKPCGCGEKDSKPSCCKDEVKQLKTDPSKASQTTVKFQKFSSSPALVFHIIPKDGIFSANISQNPSLNYLASGSGKVPIYLRNNVF
ncbi:MAG: hypothetical protein K2Q22_15245, partial [Cytophagales bacterium]|nr:hypothetical protein [Cytophagales bacterium]